METDFPTVECAQCGQPVVEAERNTPGITGTEYLDPHMTFIQQDIGSVGYSSRRLMITRNVWGYKVHICKYEDKKRHAEIRH